MIFLIIALIILFLMALLLGAYRSYCKILELKLEDAARAEIPELWRNSTFQIMSSVLVTLLSFFPCYFASLFLGYAPPELLFFFWLGLLLLARYFISYQLGFWLFWRWRQGRPLI